jgi:hypothetical protein
MDVNYVIGSATFKYSYFTIDTWYSGLEILWHLMTFRMNGIRTA